MNEIEEGNLETDVYAGGSYEIQHLGTFHPEHGHGRSGG